MDVQLIEYDQDAEDRMLAALLFPFGHGSLQEFTEQLKNLPDSEKKRLIHEYAGLRQNRRHKPGRGIEMPFYTFDIVGDYGIYRDLQRHRMLTQERQLLSHVMASKNLKKLRKPVWERFMMKPCFRLRKPLTNCKKIFLSKHSMWYQWDIESAGL